MTKLQWGLAGAIAIAGAAGVVSQAESEAALQRELEALRRQGDGVAALRAENVQLARMAAEVADLRRDDAAFARLRDETELLQKRLHAEATAQTAAGSAAAAGALNPSRVDRLPRPSFQARPRYPAELRRAGIGGEVQVEFIVDANGTVQNAFASKSTRPEFEAFAVEAVSKWRYQPGMKGGRAVFTKMSVPIVFSVGEMPVRPPPGPAEPPPNSVNLAPFHVVTTPVENTPAATAPRKSEPPAAQPAEWF